ncbi:DUF397 domain-containing protein [Nocardiopsis sp. JB363]|uniref:DUF397 domain-containing protein n=1 Tax=Nocardiopsis sp. JB363 TaxID=1434837 RepID=UPI000B3578AA|nr:DUF397 domain-containing protein [Nocardiopsis sp. JB363]
MDSSAATYYHPFRTSSYSSASDNCVEVAGGAAGTAVRDTKHRELGALSFNASEWQAFLGTARHDVD